MQITIDVPEAFLVDDSPAEAGHRLKLYAALLMFRAGEISGGGAAELADVDRFTFAAECKRHGIPVVDYPADELSGRIRISPASPPPPAPLTPAPRPRNLSAPVDRHRRSTGAE